MKRVGFAQTGNLRDAFGMAMGCGYVCVIDYLTRHLKLLLGTGLCRASYRDGDVRLDTWVEICLELYFVDSVMLSIRTPTAVIRNYNCYCLPKSGDKGPFLSPTHATWDETPIIWLVRVINDV